ncbi:MAG: polyhydroxyalkanoate depolymerase, partial [Planctomycetes bacterium]|nr:polyhydroxyalkanoate depolymerase [Planctomycetota bacterium]
GTPRWADKGGNHSWVEIWDGDWHYTGAAEDAGGKLDRAWFTGRAATARRDHRTHAIYATSFKRTEETFPLVWDRKVNYVYAVNVTDRYAKPKQRHNTPDISSRIDVEASLHAVAQLKKYLQAASGDRSAIAEQEFATVPLTHANAQEAERLLWNDHVQRIKQTRADEMKTRRLTAGNLQMPFYYTVSGDKPKHGRSLYISLHGGGGAPKQVNDRQWANQKRLYRVKEGVYLAPRAPTDTWNMWHQAHIDGLFDRLIENLIVFEDVDPNRVYLLGYSAGGDGVYQLAPRMADRFAAAAMMAGHPNEASPLGLRNVAFTIHVGAKDSPYNRNKVARQWGQKLDALQEDDPHGYVHWTNIYEGKSHWLDGQDAAALPWMAGHTRNPLPSRIVWRQDDVTGSRFYWLAVKPQEQRARVAVRASFKGQQFDVQAGKINQLIIRANDGMLNLDEVVTVTSQGKELYKGRMQRSIGTLAKTLAERGDPAAIFSGEIVVTLTKKTAM